MDKENIRPLKGTDPRAEDTGFDLMFLVST
jgi:hypothetical protein